MTFPPPTPGQAKMIWMAVTALAVSVLLAILVALVWGVGQALALLGPVLWPLAVAGILAYLLDPVVDFLVAKRIARAKAIVVVFVGAMVLVAALGASVVPQLYRETKQFVERVPAYATRVQQKLDDWMSNPPAFLQQFLAKHPTSLPGIPPSPPVLTNDTVTAPVPEGVPPVAVAETNAPPTVVDFVNRALNRNNLKSASTWLADTLPKVGQWMLGKVS